MSTSALLELERLVNTDGPPERIHELRVELGIVKVKKIKEETPKRKEKNVPAMVLTNGISIKPKKRRRASKTNTFMKTFDVNEYLELKEQGLADRKIAKQLNVSLDTLKRTKTKLGLTIANRRHIIGEDINRDRLILIKMRNQKYISTNLVINAIEGLEKENRELKQRIKELEAINNETRS